MSQFKTAALDESEPQFRQFLSYLFDQASPGIARSGVLGGIGLVVQQTTTASASVEVTAGLAVQQSSLTTGANPLINNTTATLDVLGASPMGGLPRNDLIVFDSVTASLAVVPGTPNASPTDPTPANPSVVLARLRHAAGATTVPSSVIDDLRVSTSLNQNAAPESWQAWTPTWQSETSPGSGSYVALLPGSGTFEGRALTRGKTVKARVLLIRAADTQVGAGAYRFGYSALGTPRSSYVVGNGYVLRSGTFYPCTVVVQASGWVAVVRTSDGSRVAYNNPGSWGTGDVLVFEFSMELV